MSRIFYEIEIRHDGLNKYRHIRGTDRQVVEEKAQAQRKAWNEMWAKQLEFEKVKSDRERAAKEKEGKKALAVTKTKEAEKALSDVENTLLLVIGRDCKINWEYLKDLSNFNKPKPTEPKIEEIIEDDIPLEPLESDYKYQPKLNLLDKLFSSFKKNKIDKLTTLFQDDHDEWTKTKETIIKNNIQKREKANNEYQKRLSDYDIFLKRWEKEKINFLEAKKAKNEAIDKQKEAYMSQDPDAVVDYGDRILSNSIYPDSFPQEAEIDYISETRMMIIDYLFPNIDDIPKLKEVKYIQAKDEFKEIYLADSVINKIYDSLLYNITLRSIYELFNGDVINGIDSIIFNGIVKSIDKSVGKEVTNCILSIQANREEFLNINLDAVDPKACFKKLKGVSASKLYALSAVAPIMKINREDARFIDAYGVADYLDDSTNIAAMDWQDFEHLIREIFEKEFNESGGEVKITQASRDGGVDAIAFDPDPLRGGKIVIQAKRYTNVVGVAAVRDLFGTIHNEGATKGILVTTSEYGPDAYAFAKDKPITLLNGSNLLHLLNKHGHKAKIDLKEAKKLLEDDVKK
jgi:restriction system protein